MAKTNYFWTDAVQAQDRLTGCSVMHGQQVVTIDSISGGPAGNAPTATCRSWPGGVHIRLSLDDKEFKKFRVMPPLGWVNCERLGMAVIVERRLTRARQHGLNDNNVHAGIVNPRYKGGDGLIIWRDYAQYSKVLQDPGYASCIKGEYPSLGDVFNVIQPASTIAISRIFAVNQDEDGIRWLLKESKRVGLFTGVDTLMLLRTFSFLREEIQEDETFPIRNIQEF